MDWQEKELLEIWGGEVTRELLVLKLTVGILVLWNFILSLQVI